MIFKINAEKKGYKRRIIIGGIVAAIAIAGMASGIYFFNKTPEEDLFIYGMGFGFSSVDPLITTNEEAFLIIDHVAEGLFDYQVRNGETEIIPKLATSFNWSSDRLNLTCTLREDVLFHDGTPFNAAAVKWNLERIYRVPLNTTYGFLWRLSGNQWIINDTIVISEHTIRFILNSPYAALLSLLSSRMAYIFSPTSTPEDDYIDITTDGLVGTGPFIYDSCEYILDVIGKVITSTTLRLNPYYWSDNAKIDTIIFRLFFDSTLRVEAMVSGEIDATWAPYWALETFKNTHGLQLANGTSFTFWKLIMNNKIINITMRKSISYAFNYSIFLDELSIRCLSPIMPRMLYSKWGVFNVPNYNIETARQVLKDIGWNGTANLTADNNISSGNEWEQLVIDGKPLATYNFTYIAGWGFYEEVFSIISDNLKQIGVKVEAAPVTGVEYENIIYHHRHKVELLFVGWHAPDLDPHNTLRLFNAKEPSYNIGQINDTQVQQWIDAALVEVNETNRENLYYNIQQRLIEELYPVVWVDVNIFFDVFGPNVKGIQTLANNPEKFILKGVYLE